MEDISKDVIAHSGIIGEFEYKVISGGNNTTGNISSIVINGKEFSKNARGMNIVVVDDGEVTASIAFDTFLRSIPVTK